MNVPLVLVLDGVCWGMLLGLSATGMALALRAGATLNLAHGLTYLTGSYIAAALAGTWAGLAAAVGVAAVTGTAGGIALAALLRPLTGHLQQALATAGVALAGGHLLTLAFGPDPRSVTPPPGLDRSVAINGQLYPTYRLALLAATVILTGTLWWLLSRTHLGMLVRASAQDPTSLALLGRHPMRLRIAVLAAAGGLAAVAGALGAPLIGPAPGVDHRILIASLLIAVISTRGPATTLLAALAVGQLHTTAVAAWPQAAAFLPYTLLAAAMLATALLRRHPA